MSHRYRDLSADSASGPDLHDTEVVEVPLLLPGWQISALETAAHDCGLTAAEMVRHLLRDFIARFPESADDSGIFRKNRLNGL
jgi:hypothetical protein